MTFTRLRRTLLRNLRRHGRRPQNFQFFPRDTSPTQPFPAKPVLFERHDTKG